MTPKPQIERGTSLIAKIRSTARKGRTMVVRDHQVLPEQGQLTEAVSNIMTAATLVRRYCEQSFSVTV